MKGLVNLLAMSESILEIGYHSVVSRMKLQNVIEDDKYKHLNHLYKELYGGFSPSTDRYQFMLFSTNMFNIGFLAYDTEIDDVCTVIPLVYPVRQSTLYSDWASLSPTSSDAVFYDSTGGEVSRVDVSKELTEDEHFQLMMLYNVPEFEDVQPTLDYLFSVQPLLVEYDRYNIIAYKYLDSDISELKYKPEFFAEFLYENPDMQSEIEESISTKKSIKRTKAMRLQAELEKELHQTKRGNN